MNHPTEEQLILHYYGEEGDALGVEQHLDACEACRDLYASVQRVLNVVDSLPVPARGAEYGAQVWQRLESRLPVRRRWFAFDLPWRWASAAAAVAVLLATAFLAGRFYPQPRPAQFATADPQDGDRVLLVAVSDYLERSQMMLVELSNTDPRSPIDISPEKQRAADLISESRLYRQTAAHEGQDAVAGVLDDLESVLLEISHSPSQMTPGSLEQLRERLRAEGILFKIRVLGSNVRDREQPPADLPSGGKRL
jgi:hypothetical protein